MLRDELPRDIRIPSEAGPMGERISVIDYLLKERTCFQALPVGHFAGVYAECRSYLVFEAGKKLTSIFYCGS